MSRKIEFNNGFIVAIALFLEHRDNWQLVRREDSGEVVWDGRLYTATDHLFDMEIPTNLNIVHKNIADRIKRWRNKCFKHRLDFFKDSEITDKLFKEAEDILVKIDEVVFRVKKVKMYYR